MPRGRSAHVRGRRTGTATAPSLLLSLTGSLIPSAGHSEFSPLSPNETSFAVYPSERSSTVRRQNDGEAGEEDKSVAPPGMTNFDPDSERPRHEYKVMIQRQRVFSSVDMPDELATVPLRRRAPSDARVDATAAWSEMNRTSAFAIDTATK
mmetsp:Transcript_23420/g.53722  ORF Transcript_23420/g.53722 Transcript_23420/m.53722 type:complete len:151 (+) Transcript_23420:791-1243(+)